MSAIRSYREEIVSAANQNDLVFTHVADEGMAVEDFG
jgi:hypothetical protein